MKKNFLFSGWKIFSTLTRKISIWSHLFFLVFTLLPGANLFSQVVNLSQAGVIEGGNGVSPNLTGASTVAIQGNYAYVVGTGNVLQILDITLPGLPITLGSIANGTDGASILRSQSIAVQGDYAYISSYGGNALEIVDVSNPAKPVHKGIIRDGGGSEPYLNTPWGIYVSGDYAYVASSGSNALEIIDVSNPAFPTHKGVLLDGGGIAPYLSSATGIFVSGNYAYLTAFGGGGNVEIVDITDPAKPGHVGFLFDGAGSEPFLSAAYSIVVSGKFAYLPSQDQNSGIGYLEILDISDPTTPVHKGYLQDGLGSAPFLPSPFAVTVSGNYVYVANASAAFEVVNVTDPANPVHAGGIVNSLFGRSRAVVVLGNYAYVPSRTANGLNIIDVSNPTTPLIKSTPTTGTGGAVINNPNSVFVSGNYAYVTSRITSGFEIVDVTNPSKPQHKASLTNGANGASLVRPFSVFVSGSNAFVADNGGSALEIIDVSNPSIPVHKGKLTNGSGGASLIGPTCVFVAGNYAYLSTSNALEIVDITNPSVPLHKGSLLGGAGVAPFLGGTCVYVVGNYAYVASYIALEIIDVTNPALPIHKGSIIDGNGTAPLLSNPTSLYVSGNYAYVTSQNNALEIIDITDPANPVHKSSLLDGAGQAPFLDFPKSVFVSGNYAFVASQSSKALEVIDISDPSAPVHFGSLSDGQQGALLNSPTAVFVAGNYVYATSTGLYQNLNIGYLYGPSLTSFTPSSGAVGSSISVAGQNFNTLVKASVGGTNAVISKVSATALTFTVPPEAKIGPVTLNYTGQIVTSDDDFIVAPSARRDTLVQQTSFSARWSDVGAFGYFLDVSKDNFNTFVGTFNNLPVPDDTVFNVTGLDAGTSYQYRVRSSNGDVSSINSNSISTLTLPANPLAAAASGVTQTSFIANWNAVPSATGYRLDVATDPDFTSFLNGIEDVNASSQSQAISGTASGITYYYRVRAVNASGTSSSSLAQSVITIPSAPVASPATAITTTGFTANWSSSTGANLYYLDLSTDNFATFITGFANQPVGTGNSFQLTGLTSGTNYQYRVRAANTSGSSGNSNIASVSTTPLAPKTSDALALTQSSFNLSWSNVTGATSYSLDISNSATFTTFVSGYQNFDLGNVLTYAVNTNLSPATTYYVRVRANNTSGSSVNSNVITVTTLSAVPTAQSTGIVISGIGSASVTVNFTLGNGASHLMVINAKTALNALPANATSYAPNTTFGQGSPLGSGYVVGNSAGPITVTGLSPATAYFVQVFEFNGSSGAENYLTTSTATNPISTNTYSIAPANQPTNLSFTNASASSVTVSYTNSASKPAGYLVLRSSGSVPSAGPVNGVSYALGAAIGNAVVAYYGSSLSFFDGGLPTSTKYYYNVFSFNGIGVSTNYLTANPLQGNVTLDVTPPVISATSNPATLTGATPFNATITDNVSVAAAKIFYRGISKKKYDSALMIPGAAGNYSIQVQTSWYDSLGLEYFFWAVDENGNATPKPPGSTSFAQLTFPTINLPSLPTGTGQSSYRIVAFPYLLPTDNKITTVYNNVPWTDNTKAGIWWWNPTLNNNSGGYDKYGPNSVLQTVDPGKGYWIITSEPATPQLSNITAPKYNQNPNNLYSMTLKPNWNEIGNPYPVPISWDQVRALNANSNFSPLNIFNGSSYETVSSLTAFKGGFVKNNSSSDITIQIPFPSQSSLGGRLALIGSDVSDKSWNLFLHIAQDGSVNRLGGFGMHPLACSGSDRYDNFNPPRFLDVPEVNFVNADFPDIAFSTDMVKSQDSFTWQFTASGTVGRKAQLNWNDGILSSTTKQLFLFDEELVKIIDMTTASSYDFVVSPNSRFQIFYGSNILEKVTSLGILVSAPYPNPLTPDGLATINLALPDNNNEYSVNLQLFNAQGEIMGSLNKSFAPGIHPVEILMFSNSSPAGIYIYKLSIASELASSVYSGKIIKP